MTGQQHTDTRSLGRRAVQDMQRGMHNDMWLSHEEVASLLQNGELVLECVEDYNVIRSVTDFVDKLNIFSQRRFTVRLTDLIGFKLGYG
jgi:hypothetical protein